MRLRFAPLVGRFATTHTAFTELRDRSAIRRKRQTIRVVYLWTGAAKALR